MWWFVPGDLIALRTEERNFEMWALPGSNTFDRDSRQRVVGWLRHDDIVIACAIQGNFVFIVTCRNTAGWVFADGIVFASRRSA